MSTCAVCQLTDGLVVNMIVAEPTDSAPDGTELVLVSEGTVCSMGYTWNGSEFIAPTESA